MNRDIKTLVAPALAVITALAVQSIVMSWHQKDVMQDSLVAVQAKREVEQKQIKEFMHGSSLKLDRLLEMINENKSDIKVINSKLGN